MILFCVPVTGGVDDLRDCERLKFSTDTRINLATYQNTTRRGLFYRFFARRPLDTEYTAVTGLTYPDHDIAKLTALVPCRGVVSCTRPISPSPRRRSAVWFSCRLKCPILRSQQSLAIFFKMVFF